MKQQPTAKRGPGRPAKLTLSHIGEVGQRIALGLTEEQACLSVGVNYKTFVSARKRNPEFAGVVKRCQAEFLLRALNDIRSGKKGWQGCAWILERRHRPQFDRTYAMPQDPAASLHGANGNQISPEVLEAARQIAASAPRWRKSTAKTEPIAMPAPTAPPAAPPVTQTDDLAVDPRRGIHPDVLREARRLAELAAAKPAKNRKDPLGPRRALGQNFGLPP
jgi:hypothetical protein